MIIIIIIIILIIKIIIVIIIIIIIIIIVIIIIIGIHKAPSVSQGPKVLVIKLKFKTTLRCPKRMKILF